MRRAVDIALLPRVSDARTLVTLNERLLEESDSEIRLSLMPAPGRGLPHLSLFMGALDNEALPAAIELLAGLAADRQPISTEVRALETRDNSAGGRTTSITLAGSASLSDLHEAVRSAFAPLLQSDPRREELVEPDDGDADRALHWIAGYADRTAGDGFDPHVTLGHGGPLEAETPDHLVFDRLGIYALGPGCTCRKEILGIDLRRQA